MYIVWFDYGSEGWSPTECETSNDVLQAIAGCAGMGYKVTKKVNVVLNIEEVA